ncbi:Transcriptional activator of proteases prtT [Leucoagaricus sp. SymC.cos]|nr:Transcriptional activator of proteases prtT [Leucoagaricus sp. SymC.cos]
MDSAPGSSQQHQVKKQEDDDKTQKPEVKPVVKTLNRVPRMCLCMFYLTYPFRSCLTVLLQNACRKQKMRCEGADNPPCRRCRNTGLECLFEKPSREATLTGEAGLERIKSLEAHVAEIKNTQIRIESTLAELAAHLRAGSFTGRSPSTYPPSSFQQSPSLNSPAVSTPTASHPTISDLRQPRSAIPGYQSQPGTVSTQQGSGGEIPPQLSPSYANFPPGNAPPYQHAQGQMLPPISSIQGMGQGGSSLQSNMPSRYQNVDQRSLAKQPVAGVKRPAPSSNVPSADSSDVDDDENGELPASGLVAPWEVLRGLADVAIERAAKENGDGSEPHSRARTPSPERDRHLRPSKRRKLRHKVLKFTDVVTKSIITESEARELFKIFYRGCSTFLPVFDKDTDTYDALHERSPFAVNCICMVAARVRDGGGLPSETYLRCLEEVQSISCATLFAPVMRCEAVQSMILVSGWSDNGWLSGGHAVRMAMEYSMHKAWPKLYRRMLNGKVDPVEDRELVIASRTWFCLYLFEHQLSYGTGRPAVLKDDESIKDCRYLLRHPLAIEDDMRLVSTVELMAIREEVQNALPTEGPVLDEHYDVLRDADLKFKNWYATWDQAFSQKYADATFYRQSLQLQHVHAELFHNATALRGINGPEDAERMPAKQRDLAIKSIEIARQGLDITLNFGSYRENMKYAVHYTHATATFMGSFLLRLARLFPNDCDTIQVRNQVENLANLMAEIPGQRYALTLQVMLRRSKRRKHQSNSRSPASTSRENPRAGMMIDHPGMGPNPMAQFQPYPVPAPMHHHYLQHNGGPTDAEHIVQDYRTTSNEQLPVWISDQTLGGNTFTQMGMDAFLLPTDYLPPAPQIW